jgi:hypothetical protein
MPLPFEGLVNAAFALVIVAIVSAVAVWLARLYYLPHRVGELSELSAEAIKRRKAIYELTVGAAGLALLVAFLMFLRSCS